VLIFNTLHLRDLTEMPSRKRSFDNGADAVSSGNAILDQVRNMWQFANLCQWIYIFGKAVKLDDAIDIDVSLQLAFLHEPSIICHSLTSPATTGNRVRMPQTRFHNPIRHRSCDPPPRFEPPGLDVRPIILRMKATSC
jgi:hypothetical protein